MRKFGILLVIISLFLFGCATNEVKLEKTQLQIRQFQTRIYDTNDTKMVMKAMTYVLQDEGFIIKNVAMDLGLLSAEKTIDVENKAEATALILLFGIHATWKKASVIECTANVNEYGNQTRVRVNFQVKVLDNKGGIREVKQIEDEKYYQEFFSKLDKAIFIQKEKL
jgi:hypothetical protein